MHVLLFLFTALSSFAGQEKEIKHVYSAQFDSAGGGVGNSSRGKKLSIIYGSGGCSIKNHKTKFKLEIVNREEKKFTDHTEVKARVMVRAFSSDDGECTAFYPIHETVDLDKLLLYQVMHVGLISLDPKTYLSVTYELGFSLEEYRSFTPKDILTKRN